MAPPNAQTIADHDLHAKILGIMESTVNARMAELGYTPDMPGKLQQAQDNIEKARADYARVYDQNAEVHARCTELETENAKLRSDVRLMWDDNKTLQETIRVQNDRIRRAKGTLELMDRKMRDRDMWLDDLGNRVAELEGWLQEDSVVHRQEVEKLKTEHAEVILYFQKEPQDLAPAPASPNISREGQSENGQSSPQAFFQVHSSGSGSPATASPSEMRPVVSLDVPKDISNLSAEVTIERYSDTVMPPPSVFVPDAVSPLLPKDTVSPVVVEQDMLDDPRLPDVISEMEAMVAADAAATEDDDADALLPSTLIAEAVGPFVSQHTVSPVLVKKEVLEDPRLPDVIYEMETMVVDPPADIAFTHDDDADHRRTRSVSEETMVTDDERLDLQLPETEPDEVMFPAVPPLRGREVQRFVDAGYFEEGSGNGWLVCRMCRNRREAEGSIESPPAFEYPTMENLTLHCQIEHPVVELPRSPSIYSHFALASVFTWDTRAW